MSTVTLHPHGTGPSHTHRVGDTLRAIKIYVRAAFGVIVLGEYAEEAGVRRRAH